MKTILFETRGLAIGLSILCLLSRPALAQDVSDLPNQKPVVVSGNLSVSADLYRNVEGRERLDPLAWTFSGSTTVSLYGISIPLYVLVNNQSRSVSGPFQQFGLSPTYKWLKVHGGYRNLTFSPYTLGGRLFLGGGVELNPGKIRFGAMYGRFQNAETGNSSGFTSPDAPLPTPAFRRTGYAVKVGYGSETNFVDLIYFRAKDDSRSLTFPTNSRILPDENAVFGLSSQLTLFKRLSWTTHLGLSAYTRNLLRAENTEITAQAGVLSNLITPRISTNLTYAGETSLRYSSSLLTLQLQYREIAPDYQSMGAYFFNTDLREITVSPSLVLLENKLQVSGSYGYQQDNIGRLKLVTTRRQIGSVNVSYQPNERFGVVMNYANYGTSQNNPDRIIDTLKIQQVNQNAMIAPRLFFGETDRSHVVSAIISYQNTNDFNTVSQIRTEFNSLLANLTYTYGQPKQRINLTPGLSVIRNYLPTYSMLSMGATLMVSKGFLDGKLTSTLSGQYYQNSTERGGSGSTTRVRVAARYRPAGQHEFSLSTSLVDNRDTERTSRTFRELYGQVAYGISF